MQAAVVVAVSTLAQELVLQTQVLEKEAFLLLVLEQLIQVVVVAVEMV
jgi:hypothetical protein